MTSALRNIPRGIWILAFAALALRVAFMVASVDLADDNYNLSYMRHTGQWWEIYRDLSLEECLAAVRAEPHFLP